MVMMLTRSDLKKLLHMKEVIEMVEMAFKELQKGAAIVPKRATITLSRVNG